MPTATSESPSFHSDKLRLLWPLLSEKVFKLARERIATGDKFFKGRELTVKATLREVKLALIVAHEMNPYEDFSAEEEALMRGIDAGTVRKRKEAKELRPL